MSNQPPGPFLFDPLPDDPEEDRPEEEKSGEPRTRHDAPSHHPTGSDSPPTAPPHSARPQQVLFEEPTEDQPEEGAAAPTRRHRRRQTDPNRVTPLARLTAGLIDLAALLGVALLALLGSRLLGVETDLRLLPGVVLFVVIFSFAYHVFPLLFWGRTPGMATADLVTRDPSGKSLTAWQSTLRWAGSVGTVIFVGIPMIVSWFTGWSLADLVSGSETRVDPA